jgi:hypothetical protein
MRRHEHVATVRIRRNEAGQRLPLEIAREEQPSTRRLNGKHEARFVVCRHRIVHRIFQRYVMHVWIAAAAVGRMQHADAAERIDRE